MKSQAFFSLKIKANDNIFHTICCLIGTLKATSLHLLENFVCFSLSADQLFRKNNVRNTIRVSNSLVSDQAQQSAWSDLGPNCLQRLSADDTSRQEVKSKLSQASTTIFFWVWKNVLPKAVVC